MIKLTPILVALGAALSIWFFSAWRLRRTLERQSTPLRDPTLGSLLQRLARSLGVARIPVHVYEIEPVNGLASPDGRVFITRGFLRRYQAGEVSAEEIVSVIAHEIGHVALGHANRRMLDFAGQNVLRMVLSVLLGRFIPVVGVYVANVLTVMVAARLSRQDECEADAYAAALMTKAGFGVAPQLRLFEKLERLAPAQGQVAWLMSHPKTADRIAAIETLAATWEPRPRLPR